MSFYTLNLSKDEYYALEDILTYYYSVEDKSDIDEEAFHSLIDKIPSISHRVMYL
tara:strand:- start:381 stop:545 length:165 start_codon:yes stop_codon:yes gene_type:complete